MIGKTISHYNILSKLGEGGMGVVYKAEDTRLKRFVALKFLPQSLTLDDLAKERFIQEAQAVSALEHPNICNIHEINETEDGQMYIVMACYEGQTLKEKLAQGPLSITDTIDIAEQIAKGLAKAHGKGIIHRDIKPANILITEEGIVKILDFGLAKLAGQNLHTKTGSTLGTVAYMSPEQAQGLIVDQRTDIWSLGVVLYEMLTGRLPFAGEFDQAVIYGIVNQEIESIQKLRPEIPQEIVDIIHRALQKEPKDRYQSIKDMGFALQQFAQNFTNHPKSLYNNKIHYQSYIILILSLFIALGTSAVLIFKSCNATVTPSLRIVKATDYAGNESYPAFSPDGEFLAFSWNGDKQDNYDIYVKELKTGTLMRITSHPGLEYCPVWSGDGKRIAFCRSVEGEATVCIVSAQGGEAHQAGPGNWCSINTISWTADNRMMAVSGRRVSSDRFSIYLLSPASDRLESLIPLPLELYGDVRCAFSPDGKNLAFIRNFTNNLTGDLYVFELANGKIRRLTSDNKYCGQPLWLSDDEILFSSDRNESQSLWRIFAKGGEPQPVPVAGSGLQHLSFSSSKEMLAFEESSINYEIYKLPIPIRNSEKAEPQKIISSTVSEGMISISSNGTKLLFLKETSSPHYFDLWSCDSSGNNARCLRAKAGRGCWSPDGNKVVFDARQQSQANRDIFILDVPTMSETILTTPETDDLAPWWSQDGRWIYFTSKRSGDFEIYRMTTTGDQLKRLTYKGGFAPRVAINDNWLYYTKDRYQTRLCTVAIDGGEEQTVLDNKLEDFGAWSVTKDDIFFIERKENHPVLNKLSFKSGQIEKVFDLSEKDCVAPVVSPDGRYLYYSQADYEIADILLVENFK